MRIGVSEHLNRLPPYLFADLETKVAEKRARGERVYDLSIGDPDLPTPPQIIRVMNSAAMRQKNQGYSLSKGEQFYREAVTDWYRKRFGVKLDPMRDVCALMGSKDGIANIARAFLNQGDRVLIPDPGYPVYANGATILNGGTATFMPLLEENGYLPDFNRIDPSSAKLMFLNYPNNPTGAIADKGFLREAVRFALDNSIILCYDNAYSELTLDGKGASSILQIPGSKDCCVELNSCSKTFNMTGSRIGFAVGCPEVISGLARIKSQVDSGTPIFIQKAGAYALSLYKGRTIPAVVRKNIDIYRRRMKILVDGLNDCGWDCVPSGATFYLWAKIEGGSMELASELLKKGIVVTPGIGFGQHGEGYVRFALTKDERIIRAVIKLLAE